MRTMLTGILCIVVGCSGNPLQYSTPPDTSLSDLAPCEVLQTTVESTVRCNFAMVFDGGTGAKSQYQCGSFTLDTVCGQGTGVCSQPFPVTGKVENLVKNADGQPWYWEWTATSSRQGDTEVYHCNNLGVQGRLPDNPCDKDADCLSGICTPFGNGPTKLCGCRNDNDCAIAGAYPTCTPDHSCSG